MSEKHNGSFFFRLLPVGHTASCFFMHFMVILIEEGAEVMNDHKEKTFLFHYVLREMFSSPHLFSILTVLFTCLLLFLISG